MVEDEDLLTTRKYADLTGGGLGNCPEHINRCALVVVETLQRELGSAPWDEEAVRRLADQVYQRAQGQISLHNEEAERRLAKAREEERLSWATEEDKILLAKGVPIKGPATDAKERAWRRHAAAEAVAAEGQVWRIGRKGTDYNDRAELAPPSHYAELRQKAAQAAREAAEGGE